MSAQTRNSTWAQLSEIYSTCDPISNATEVNNLYMHLSNGYQYMAMTDYPYPASFLEPMPAWPIKEAVKPFESIPEKEESAPVDFSSFMDTFFGTAGEKNDDNTPLTDREVDLHKALNTSTGIYFNYTGNYPCTNLSDWEGTGDLDGYGWNILACNQLAMPIGYGPDSMFVETPFDYEAYTSMCEEQYGLTPDYTWPLRYFGGFDIEKDFLALTNIVMSNGELDPWRAGGLNKNVTADGSGIALYITDGSHHIDLRLPEAGDTAPITEARAIETANIKQWIAEYHAITLE